MVARKKDPACTAVYDGFDLPREEISCTPIIPSESGRASTSSGKCARVSSMPTRRA